MSKERVTWRLLGIDIGTHSGWDGEGDTFILYDFVPAKGLTLPSGDVQFDLLEGTANTYDDIGKIIISVNIIEALGFKPKDVLS